MHKIYRIVAALIFGCGAAQASTPLDSIGVENYKGNKLILHKVDPKDTYYSIARKYGVNYKEVMSFNDSKTLNIGVTVKVPTAVPFTGSANNEVAKPAPTNGVFEYTVQKKDNLNAIAERFKTTVDDIKRLNGLRNINLQIGQVLKINGNGGLNSQNEKVNEQVVAAPVAQPKPNPKPTTGFEVYTVKKKDNLNLIAKNFNTTVDAIKSLNDLSSINLQIGQELKIPSANAPAENTQAAPEAVAQVPAKTERELRKEREAKERVEQKQKEDSEKEPTTHTVAANETIYTIAQKYHVTTFQITTTNKLSNNNLKVGQKLIIPSSRPIESFDPVAQNDNDDAENTDSILKTNALKLPANRYGLSQAEEKGTAVWISDADLDPSKMLVLHRIAAVGTIIKVTNPMTGRSTFAKVVGKFTENETTKDVIIVMTKAVADAVGALDKRFFCNITYSPQENVQ